MDDLGPLFVAPHDPDRFWILIFLVSIPAVIAAGIVLVRGHLFVRGHMPAVLTSYVLLLVPAFAYVLGDLHVLEASKKVEFCGSCHTTMSPIVAAMKGDGDSLAAVHYRNGAVPHAEACYKCHSGYGIWGGYSAKVAGVMHMVNTVTGDYQYPIELAGDFDIQSCLNCHAEATPFREVEEHQDLDVQNGLLSYEVTCSDCHESAHPADALNGVQKNTAGRSSAKERKS